MNLYSFNKQCYIGKPSLKDLHIPCPYTANTMCSRDVVSLSNIHPDGNSHSVTMSNAR